MSNVSTDRVKKYHARKRKEGFGQVNLILHDETKAELARLTKQAGSHDAAIRQLLDQARARD